MNIVLERFRATTRTLWPLLAMGGIALCVPLLAPLIAASELLVLLVLMGAVGVVGSVLILRRPFWGFCLMIASALLVPYTLSTGAQNGLNGGILLLILLVGVWVLDMVVIQRRIWLLPSRPVNVALVFVVLACLAFISGQLPWYATQSAPLLAQVAGLALYLLSVAAFLVPGHLLRSDQELSKLVWLFLGIGAIFVFSRYVPGLERSLMRALPRGVTSGAPMYLWIASLVTGQLIWNGSLSRWVKAGLGLLLAALLYTHLGEGRFWLSGWLPLVVSIAVIIVLSRPRLGILLSFGAAAVLLLNTNLINEILNEGDNAYSMLTRWEALRIILSIVSVNPFLGLGMANYYYFTPLYSILGYSVQFSSHNNYVDLVAQSGLLGLLAFFWLCWEIWRVGWRLRTIVPDGFPKAFVYGALGGLVGMVVSGALGDWIIPFVYNIGLEGFRSSMVGWYMLGGLLLLERQYAHQETKNVQLDAVGPVSQEQKGFDE